jgi:hypothetical protein
MAGAWVIHPRMPERNKRAVSMLFINEAVRGNFNTVKTCHPEALLLREGSPAVLTTYMQSRDFSAHQLEVFLEEPRKRQFSPADRGRSFAQKKRFRMTDALHVWSKHTS